MMTTYTFPQAMLLDVTDHANSLDIVISTMLLLNGEYTITTETPFPVEQLEHLSLTVA